MAKIDLTNYSEKNRSHLLFNLPTEIKRNIFNYHDMTYKTMISLSLACKHSYVLVNKEILNDDNENEICKRKECSKCGSMLNQFRYERNTDNDDGDKEKSKSDNDKEGDTNNKDNDSAFVYECDTCGGLENEEWILCKDCIVSDYDDFSDTSDFDYDSDTGEYINSHEEAERQFHVKCPKCRETVVCEAELFNYDRRLRPYFSCEKSCNNLRYNNFACDTCYKNNKTDENSTRCFNFYCNNIVCKKCTEFCEECDRALCLKCQDIVWDRRNRLYYFQISGGLCDSCQTDESDESDESD